MSVRRYDLSDGADYNEFNLYAPSGLDDTCKPDTKSSSKAIPRISTDRSTTSLLIV